MPEGIPGRHLIVAARLRVAAALVLVLGLLAAVAVYAVATTQGASDGVHYEIVNSQAYPVQPNGSDREAQQLERLGGKASVLTVQLDRWFSSLWSGERLAYTLAVLSGAIALGCWYVAGLMAEELDP